MLSSKYISTRAKVKKKRKKSKLRNNNKLYKTAKREILKEKPSETMREAVPS